MSIVVCKIPKAGLGNQLFPILHALLFAKLNGNLPIIFIGYHQFKIGPYLRREKVKRNYQNYFLFEKSLIGEAFDRMKFWLYKFLYTIIKEPEMRVFGTEERMYTIFFFEKLPTYHDYFIHLRDYRDGVKQSFLSILRPWIKEKLDKLPSPVIGVHVRMGDFRKLKEGEDFSKVGHVRTPEEYFVDQIETIRTITRKTLRVSVFSDGYSHEFEKLLAIKDVSLEEGNADIVDMLLLSESKILMSSGGSTFSYWSGFLSNAILIMHPDHLHAPIRPAQVNAQWYEGPLQKNQMDPILAQNLSLL